MILLYVKTFMLANEIICVRITDSEGFIVFLKVETANFQ